MSQYHNALLAESILFFNLGACFAINETDPLDIVKRKNYLFLSIWILLASLDILSHGIFYLKGAFFVHRMSLVTNIFAFIFLADMLIKGEKGKINSFLAGSVFWVFAIHDHLAIALRRFMMIHWGECSDMIHILLYFFSVFIVIFICLLSYAFMRTLFPDFVKFSTGNRTS
jgi:hypothetical protein